MKRKENTMYKLLIVDDEKHIADGLYRTFSSISDISLEVYRTYSAPDALELFTRYRMDILITDIDMPVTNGLDLVSEIKKRWPDCRTIILSGYSEFDYAQTALSYHCDYYILKSQGDEPLIDAVTECIRRLEQASREKSWTRQLESELQRVRPMLQQTFLNNLLKSPSVPAPEAARCMEDARELGLSLYEEKPFFLVGCRLDRPPIGGGPTELPSSLIEIHIIFQNCLTQRAICTPIFSDEPQYLLWLIQSTTDEPDASFYAFINGSAENFYYCMRNREISLSLLLDPSPFSFGQFSAYGRKMLFLLKYRMGKNEEMVLSNTDFYTEAAAAPDYERLLQQLQQLEFCLARENADSFLGLLENLLRPSVPYGSEQQAFLLNNLKTLFLNTLYKTGRQNDFLKDFRTMSIFYEPCEKDASSLSENLYRVGCWLIETQDEERSRRYNRTLHTIHTYIREHLNEEITLTTLAEQVYLNPVYLSHIYKQLTGQKLGTYITGQRIERAKELLAEPELKINEIGYRVGYESSPHFSRTFKKVVGITPAEYRKKYFVSGLQE